MSLPSEIRTVASLLFRRARGASHAERLESFYGAQADDYDRFRRRLLWGREALLETLAFRPGETWVDLGGGTAANAETVAKLGALDTLATVHVVDLSTSLLETAKARAARLGWSNVKLHRADATRFGETGSADVVTFSYSLTMIPDWWEAIQNAHRLLKPGGRIGVVDFGFPRKWDEPRPSWWTRSFWPAWFSNDNVFLSDAHIPYLRAHFRERWFKTHAHRLPYLPLKAPCYAFVGVR